MPSDRLMLIHSPEFQAMAERVLRVTELTSRLTIYPPFYTDHGLHLDLGERVFINQGCTFLDYAGIRLGDRVMVGPKVTFITSIGRDAVIAAGSVVADDVPAASLVTGTKATVRRRW
jgi:acetyltransferase-like isoleucine patch superfamily enzyme